MDVPSSAAAAHAVVTSLPSVTRETYAPRTPKPLREPLRTADFRRVYDNGFRVSSSLFAAFCLPRPTGATRLGLTVPRAIGGAVIRNRIKRRMREACRTHPQFLLQGWDFVFNPRRTVLDAPFADLQKAIGKVMDRCNSHS